MRRFLLLSLFIILSCEKKVLINPEREEKPKKEVSLSEGISYFNTMRYKKSSIFFLKNLSSAPEDWRLNFLVGLSLLKTGKTEYAKRYLSRSMELSEEIKDYIYYFLALTFFQNEEMEAALEAIELLKGFNDSALLCDGLLLRIKVLYKMELYEEALKSVEMEYIPNCGERTEAKVLELRIHCRNDEIEKAKEVVKKLWMRRDFSIPEIESVKGCMEEGVKRFITKEMVFQKMKLLMGDERWNDLLAFGKYFFDEYDPTLYFFMGKALYYMRNLRESREKLERSLKDLPISLRCEAEFFLGKIAERLRDVRVLDIYKSVYEKYPDCEFADNAFFKIANLSKDESLFKDFIKRFPNSDLIPEVQWQLAWSAIRRNAPSSITYLAPITTSPTGLNSKAIFWMTEAMRRNGDKEEADKILKEFMQKSSPDYYWVSASYYVKEVTFPIQATEWKEFFNTPLPHKEKISSLLSIGIFELIEKEVNHILRKYPERATEFLYNISEEYPDFTSLLKNTSISSFYYPLAYKESVFRYAGEFSLDPYLILAVIKAESAFQRFAISRANAKGVMQIISPTAYFISSNFKMDDFDLSELFLPDVNIKMGTWYLRFLIDRFSEIVPAISAYNAGPENVNKWCSENGEMRTIDFIESIPFSETYNYVKRVIYYYAVYKNLYSPPFEPERLFKEKACKG